MDKQKTNHLAVAVMIVIHQFIGFIWYSPVLFGNLWLSLVEKNISDINAKGNHPYIVSLLGSFTFCYFLIWLIQITGAKTFSRGIKLGFLSWAGVAVPIGSTHAVFQGLPPELIFIDMGQSLLSALLAGAVLASWQLK